MSASADTPQLTCPKCDAPLQRGGHLAGQCLVCLLEMALEEEQIPTATPERFDHYEVLVREDGTLFELGRGAMGITFRASDTVLGNDVALKVIDTRIAAHPEARERFLREARAAARLRHPNVALVFYYGVRKSDGQCFYAMELVEGETLAARLRRVGPLPTALALEVIAQVARALVAAEAQALVHRDLKPANLMLVEGTDLTVKVIDFGLAKAAATAGSETDLTHGGFVGTPAFASPERFTGTSVDVRSDLYSLGITLWEMLTGQTPFRGDYAQVMYQHQYAPLPLGQLEGVPQPVVVLVEVLLEKDPGRRFQNPTELLRALPNVTRALQAKRTIKHQNLRVTFDQQKELPARRAPKRSVAVLPFDTLSRDKRNTYFADGFQDEILSSLAKISQLKVISRTSVMTYRPEAKRDLRSLARILGVANVVEGTVRRDGNRVRITIRLVDARNDNMIWADSFDRDLTDIFAIQSEIAQEVASRLSAQLSPEERKDMEAKPTNNLEAYDLYLQAKHLLEGNYWVLPSDEKKLYTKIIRLLEEATQKDIKFTLAYCLIAKAHDALYWNKIDQTPERRAMADRAENEALRLRPDLAEVRILAAWHYFVYREDERALTEIAVVQQGLPNNTEAFQLVAFIKRRQGSWKHALRVLHRALIWDPRHPITLDALAETYYWLRRYREVERIFDRQIAFAPNHLSLKAYRASVALEEKADLEGYRAVLEKLPSSARNTLWITSLRCQSAVLARDWKNAKEILSDSPHDELYFSFSPYSWANSLVPSACHGVWVAALQGGHPIKGGQFVSARDQLKQKTEVQPDDPSLMSVLGLIDAALGRKEEAIQEARRAVEMLPISKDAVEGPPLVSKLALVYAWTNEPDLAFQELAISVDSPGGVHYGELQLDPAWDPLREDRRFAKVLAKLAPKKSKKTVDARIQNSSAS
jgi:serine/threonine protein kinase/tetratricopeptide (TPR) repeat protein